MFHAFLGEKLPDWQAAASLVRKIAENYKLPYYTLSPTYSVCKNDGYLAGEQFTCPHCGESAEVYSRITGYYRPVQNWNAGKTQEYKERKTYDLSHSHLDPVKHPHTAACGCDAEPDLDRHIQPAAQVEKAGQALLFTTPTCPNCRLAVTMLDKQGFAYEKLNAEDNAELAKKYGVKQAPTLIVTDGEHFEKYAGAGAIRQYAANVAQ